MERIQYIPKPKRKPKITYYLRKSTTKKSYLNKEKHMKRFKPKKIYSNTITCFACNELGHLSSACPNRKNLYTKESTIVGCTNLNLIEVQSDISDTSLVYSIISMDDMEEIPPTTDYSLANSLLAKPYGIAEKYNITIHDIFG